MTMELKICHLYPDALNMYGDRGNVLCVQKRLQWRGIDCQVEGVGIGQPLDETKYDMFFMGAGQSFEQGILLEDLKSKGEAIRAAIEGGKPFLAVCGGFELLGKYHESRDGTRTELLGAIDMYTVEGKDRMIGDYMFSCDDLDGQNVVAFENHAGRTYLGDGVRPVGKIVCGHGNNGHDGLEGARYKHFFGTYGHGCLLPKNPRVADLLISWAMEQKYPEYVLTQLDDSLEQGAFDYMADRIQKAGSR